MEIKDTKDIIYDNYEIHHTKLGKDIRPKEHDIKKWVAVDDLLNIQISFSERKELENRFTNWAIKNNAEVGIFNAINWLLDIYKNKLKDSLSNSRPSGADNSG